MFATTEARRDPHNVGAACSWGAFPKQPFRARPGYRRGRCANLGGSWMRYNTGVIATRPEGAALDVESVRLDFPILRQTVHGHPLVYLDNAATTQKPFAVIESMDRYYREDNSN